MNIRTTHTCALLGVPPDVYRLICDKLVEAGYAHVFVNEGDGEWIDMSGIGLQPTEPVALSNQVGVGGGDEDAQRGRFW